MCGVISATHLGDSSITPTCKPKVPEVDNDNADIEVEVAKDKLPEEPTSPKDPFSSQGYGRTYIGGYEDRVAEIQNAIRMLSMSDEEIVSTSTYQSVSRYL